MSFYKIKFFFLSLLAILNYLIFYLIYLLPDNMSHKYWETFKYIIIAISILASILCFIFVILIIIDKYPENLVFFPYKAKN
jgi:hypothetical protein